LLLINKKTKLEFIEIFISFKSQALKSQEKKANYLIAFKKKNAFSPF
jgi:hypothetical protein